jgi:hypothetical protein
MLADELDYVIGVDPHRDTHAIAVVEVRSGGVAWSTLLAVSSRPIIDEHMPWREIRRWARPGRRGGHRWRAVAFPQADRLTQEAR